MIDDLARRIWSHEAFQAEYRLLLQEHLSRSTKVSGATGVPLRSGAVRRLTQSAAHLAASRETEHREAAYRIAAAVWRIFGTEFGNLRDLTLVVFGRLGNFPAASFLYSGDVSGRGEHLPDPLWFELLSHELANSVHFARQERLVLTDFQKRLWESLERGQSVAVTAPTSAGKSFALQRFLMARLRQRAAWGLYIVPTRALISQVSTSLIDLIQGDDADTLAVSTIPLTPEELGKPAGIYVLTQERLQVLLEAEPGVNFDLVVVDEAQMVGDGARGVILQTVVERIRDQSPDVQLFFGSPQTKNPSFFAQLFGIYNADVVVELESPVAQNLIFLDSDPIRTDEVVVSALVNGQEQLLGRVGLEQGLYDTDQTLASLAWVFGRDEKSLVYAGGQARCETIADMLVQLAKSPDAEPIRPPDPELEEFAKFLGEHVHPRYLLVESVRNGVAFHYGNMPAIVRKTVEEYFSEGLLSFLVCTSTLLHGVNLPAKNLFLLDPTKGREWGTSEDIPISSLEFWNLAGRAGRLGKDFEGNVYLIDRARWRSRPLEGERQQLVTSALSDTITNSTLELAAYIRDIGHPSGGRQTLENTFVKLFNDHRKGRLSVTLDRMGIDEQNAVRRELVDLIAAATADVDVPSSITERNINVSVYRQQSLLDYFRKRIPEIGPAEVVPVHPLRPWDEAHGSLLRVFRRIHNYFEGKPGRDRSQYYFAPLALRWMRGEPLSRLIDSALDHKRSRSKREPKIATVIREVMADVEQDLRFRYVKYMTCYNDLLAEALRQTGHAELVNRIPAIPLFLELGASSRTMVNLIGLGLSRTAAGIVTEKAVNKDMVRPQAERWLRQQRWESSDVSPVVLREVRRVLRG